MGDTAIKNRQPDDSDGGLQTAGFRRRASDGGLQTAGLRRRASDGGLQTAGFRREQPTAKPTAVVISGDDADGDDADAAEAQPTA